MLYLHSFGDSLLDSFQLAMIHCATLFRAPSTMTVVVVVVVDLHLLANYALLY